jgi:hypothetical protein
MRFEKFSFGSIRIDDVTYERDVVIDRGAVQRGHRAPRSLRVQTADGPGG